MRTWLTGPKYAAWGLGQKILAATQAVPEGLGTGGPMLKLSQDVMMRGQESDSPSALKSGQPRRSHEGATRVLGASAHKSTFSHKARRCSENACLPFPSPS